MANIDIFGTLTNATGEPIVNASQVGSGINASEGELMQDTINSNLMEGKIYDAENGEWVSYTSEPTEATTTTFGGIKIANKRGENETVDINSGGTSALDRYYGVELDKDGKAFVHVPWVYNAIPVADKDKLGGVMTGDNTGIKVEDQIIKADFDTDVYSVENITTHNFSTTTVASPDTVKKIFDAYNQVFLDTLGDVEVAKLNLYNAIYGTDYTETSQIPVE